VPASTKRNGRRRIVPIAAPSVTARQTAHTSQVIAHWP
jgi:hypothetical protein